MPTLRGRAGLWAQDRPGRIRCGRSISRPCGRGGPGAARHLRSRGSMLLSNKAEALLKLERWADALEWSNKAIELDETNGKARYRRARALTELDGEAELEEAAAELRKLKLASNVKCATRPKDRLHSPKSDRRRPSRRRGRRARRRCSSGSASADRGRRCGGRTAKTPPASRTPLLRAPGSATPAIRTRRRTPRPQQPRVRRAGRNMRGSLCSTAFPQRSETLGWSTAIARALTMTAGAVRCAHPRDRQALPGPGLAWAWPGARLFARIVPTLCWRAAAASAGEARRDAL